ncbi:hypothetical protein [Salinisphaera sp. G21_0]|uniref:hypothetical protein n=1 Tax=Salinisphaera sp. G21_0 TaxID=2821094 RepID=UPI001ADACB24|nr:hypothetical protein [Salinisphaera sp. G21_0]MBO9480178.1 hypothetical protein [Salinisphaera sp. G21_0]
MNSYVDGTEVNIGSIANDQLLCQKADPRVLTANCSSRTEFLDALDLSYSDSCPVNTATPIADGGTVANTTMVNSSFEGKGSDVPHGVGRRSAGAPPAVDGRVESKGWDAPHGVERRSVGEGGRVADTPAVDGSNAATASTAATLGITSGSLLAAGGLGIAAYSTYQWITGYQEGLRGQELAMKPVTRGKELASTAVNSVSQGIQGIRERMNRQSVPTQEPPHEINELGTDWDGVIE